MLRCSVDNSRFGGRRGDGGRSGRRVTGGGNPAPRRIFRLAASQADSTKKFIDRSRQRDGSTELPGGTGRAEAEAEAFLGAMAPLASLTVPSAARALAALTRRAAGVAAVGRRLRARPQTRPLIGALPGILQQTAVRLGQRLARGQAVHAAIGGPRVCGPDGARNCKPPPDRTGLICKGSLRILRPDSSRCAQGKTEAFVLSCRALPIWPSHFSFLGTTFASSGAGIFITVLFATVVPHGSVCKRSDRQPRSLLRGTCTPLTPQWVSTPPVCLACSRWTA